MTNEEIVKQIRQGDNSLMADLYEQNRRFIFTIVQHNITNRDNYDDAMQDAYFGLYEAVQGFDESKGYKFLTYAKRHIQLAVQRGQCNTMQIPEHIRLTARKIKNIQVQLAQHLNRMPTMAELSHITEISPETIKYILNTVKPLKSIYEPLADDLLLGDTIKDTSIDFENDIAASDERRYIRETVRTAIDMLPETEKTAMQLYYLQGLTYKETGQIMGVSIERVRQIINKALRKLRHKRTVYEMFEEELDLRTDFGRHKGVNAFNTTWTSITEQLVLERDYMRRNV